MMSCSEAIRLGAMLKPQSYDGMSSRNRTCALEAALDAVGSPLHWSEAVLLWRVLACPVRLLWPLCGVLSLGSKVLRLESAVVRLNDRCHWTREEIADVVERVEQAQGTQTEVHAGEPEHQRISP